MHLLDHVIHLLSNYLHATKSPIVYFAVQLIICRLPNYGAFFKNLYFFELIYPSPTVFHSTELSNRQVVTFSIWEVNADKIVSWKTCKNPSFLIRVLKSN